MFEKIVERQFYTEKDASKVIRQILEGLRAMHSKDVVHRDLKVIFFFFFLLFSFDIKI